ncbi:MBL fold metallo-hydrolase [Sporosarcina sp. Marseille-Q4063]|uniref:MBL fold metallo-hydrolase n=1 Tax=Sporosarcina sp. Marseille-Q4063 TaxID=2810514 RepID=UPI001BB0AEEC|nr:MBL fold metallo-hydrolase [Sporosarcina sp. Marseille-Q4063]QUW22593.1 MBL fold metallo-hydrolase [Sporosarcina sp. Marseille-Q4063]
MNVKDPIRLNERIFLIDGFDLGVPERTGTYVIAEEELTLVDTGPSPSVKHVKKGLETLGFSLDQVKYIIVTHIHLDHAGGAGLLLEDCPNAKVVVHPRGARHLADPTRLVAGAKMVYGERFSELFDPVVAIPEERLLIKGDGDTLEIGPTCTLKFLDTPGHAKHHFSIYDPISNGMFTGDTVGIRYEQLIRDGVDLFLPSTSPNQFDPDAMRQEIDRMLGLELNYIYFGHYGMTNNPNTALLQVGDWLDTFMKEAQSIVDEQESHEILAERLLDRVRDYLRKNNILDDHEVYGLIELDMQVSAMGLLDYLVK